MVTGASGSPASKTPATHQPGARRARRKKRCPLDTTGGLLGTLFAALVLVLLLIVVQYISAEGAAYKRRIRAERAGLASGDGGGVGSVGEPEHPRKHGGALDAIEAAHYDARYGQEDKTLPTGGASLWGLTSHRARLHPAAVRLCSCLNYRHTRVLRLPPPLLPLRIPPLLPPLRRRCRRLPCGSAFPAFLFVPRL